MTDGERIDVLEGKIAFLMALTKVQGQRLERLENAPPSEEPPPQPLDLECENRLAISARDYANDMLDKGRAEIAALRADLKIAVEMIGNDVPDEDEYQRLRTALKGNGEGNQ